MRVGALEVLLALGLSVVFCALLNFFSGRDLNWDFLNYHAYAMADVFGERLGRDFFPAGYQGYLNRLVFLPQAVLTEAGLPSLAIATVIASLHALNVFFLYMISRELCAFATRPRVVAAAVTALGVCTTAFLLQVGSTFADPLTTPFVLAAIWMLIRGEGVGACALAGILAGIAAGLKLTNATYAMGLVGAVVIARPWRPRTVAAAAACVGGVVLGFVATHGWWSWKLQALFGSPFFPLFNSWFQSPDFIPHSLRFDRFVPQTLLGLLLFPASMARSESWIYTEVVSPDVRPIALIVLFALLVARSPVGLWRRVAAGRVSPASSVVSFFLISTLAWLLTSSNGRYAIPVLLLLGPMVYLVAQSLSGPRGAGVIALTLLCIQGFMVADAGNQRFSPSVWVSRYLPIKAPETLRAEPHLYVSVSKSSHAYVSSVAHPDSAFVNPIGLLSIPTDGPGWARFLRLRDQWEGRIRILLQADVADPTQLAVRYMELANGTVDRLGLQFDPATCETVVVNDVAGYDKSGWQNRWLGEFERVQREWSLPLAVCPAVLKSAVSEELARRRALASTIMDAYEKRCPEMFYPPLTQTEGGDLVWSRSYGRFDLFMFVNLHDRGIYLSQERQATDVRVGRVDSWLSDVSRFKCRLPHGGRRDTSTLKADEAD